LGKLKKGETKEKTFKIKNIGNEVLCIKKMKACCGYSIKDISKWDINPGQTSNITVAVDATRKSPGEDRKYVTIVTNDEEAPSLEVEVFSTIIGSKELTSPRVFRVPVTPTNPPPPIFALELNELRKNKQEVLIIDVREKSEFSEKHIPGAVNFPRSSLKLDDKKFLDTLEATSEFTVVAVHCGSGARSSFIVSKLRQMGYYAFKLDGGLKAWTKAGYEISIGPKVSPTKEPLEIGLEEAYHHYYKLFKKKTLWLDVREKGKHTKGYIKDAINMPISELIENIKTLPKDKGIILYCEDESCDSARSAAKILINHGFKHPKIKVFKDGYNAWEKEGFPVEKGHI